MGRTNNNDCSDAELDARKYLDGLLSDGDTYAVDTDADSIEMQLPDWYDETLFKRAQKYYHENIFAMFSAKLIGLLSVLAIPSILRILIHTRDSGTPMKAYRRYLATIFHTMSWYDEDLVKGSRSWRSLEAVRKRHVRTSIQAEKVQVGIISQKDMALTQFGFVGYILLKPHFVGVQVSLDNFEALVHFWRVIGSMIGIEDQFNLMSDSWATTRPRLELVCKEIFAPNLSRSTAEFNIMTDSLLTGMWCFNPFLNTDAFLYYAKMVNGCENYVYLDSDLAMLKNEPHKVDTLRTLGWYSRVILFLQFLIHVYLLNFSWVRWYMNAQIYISSFIIHWFPFLAIFSFGFKRAYVRILGETYRHQH